jgi:hypothetical protein
MTDAQLKFYPWILSFNQEILKKKKLCVTLHNVNNYDHTPHCIAATITTILYLKLNLFIATKFQSQN